MSIAGVGVGLFFSTAPRLVLSAVARNNVGAVMALFQLVRVIALASYLALSLGSRVLEAGLRRLLESTRQRMIESLISMS